MFTVPKLTTREITTLGLLVALEIVLARFCSIQARNLRIGFSFLPIAMASIRFGPIPAAMAASAADILGAVLFPTTGAYFPGFTLTAFLTGVIFGLCLYRRQTAGHILAAVLLNQLGLSLLLNTTWLSIMYHSPFLPLMATRIFQCAVLGPIQFIAIGTMVRLIGRYGKKVLTL